MAFWKSITYPFLRCLGTYRRTRDSLKKKKKEWQRSYLLWKEKDKEKIAYLWKLIYIHMIYGIMLDTIAWGIFHLPFNLRWIVSFSLIAYIIKVEVPHIVRTSR